MTERAELARMRGEVQAQRPAIVLRAQRLPLRATVRHGGLAPAPVLTRRQRYAVWAKDHYAADQALRVLAIIGGGATVAAGGVLLLILALRSLFAGSGPGLVLAIAAAVVLALLAVRGVRALLARGHRGHDGMGLHLTPCKRK